MPNWETVTNSAEETIQQGRDLGARLRPPVLVLLSGELGSGKTTLTKGIVSSLGAGTEDEVTSPTFTLVHVFRSGLGTPMEFPVSDSGRVHRDSETGATGLQTSENPAPVGKVYHVDLYRVSGFHDLETLGLEDVLAEAAIVVVEWPEHMALRTRWPVVRVEMEHMEGDRRRLRIVDANGALAPASR